MTTEQRKQLRLSLLRILDAEDCKFGLEPSYLHQQTRNEGRSWLTPQQALEVLFDLEAQGLVVKQNDLMGGTTYWKISDAGRALRQIR